MDKMVTFYQAFWMKFYFWLLEAFLFPKPFESNGMEKERVYMCASVFILYLCDVKNTNMIRERASERAE